MAEETEFRDLRPWKFRLAQGSRTVHLFEKVPGRFQKMLCGKLKTAWAARVAVTDHYCDECLREAVKPPFSIPSMEKVVDMQREHPTDFGWGAGRAE
jgi:hypothetical protein